jgi:hypothetical protein
MVLLDIGSWWTAKELFEQVFWAFAIPFSGILIVLLITTFMGLDGGIDDGIDAEIDADAGAGFQFFTVKNLIGFFTIFGWVGIGCHQMGMSAGATLAIAIISGLAMMLAMSSLFYFMSRLSEDGTFKIQSAVGRIAEIYIPVPGAKKGIGKIQINVHGNVREMDAMTRDEELLATGTIVKVVEVLDGHILMVTKE